MKSYTIDNGLIKADFLEKGAELINLETNDGKKYIFRDLTVWGYSSPTLFPICGGLKDDKFEYNGKEYTLFKHGFTRDAVFSVEKHSNDSITFLLCDSDDTKKGYPFSFELRITYTLVEKALETLYSVKNTGDTEMPFQIGAHEAYLCPGGIDGYKLVFSENETLDSHKVTGNFIEYETDRIITDSNTLALSYDYFSVDALVFKSFRSDSINLCANDGSRELKVDFPGFTHLLVWTMSQVNAPYICIEPWIGGPDYIDCGYDLSKRNGARLLDSGKEFTAKHTITIIK